MQVLQRLGDGVENSARFSLREKLLSEDFVQQLAPFHQLRHQVHRAAVVVHLRHGNNTNSILITQLFRELMSVLIQTKGSAPVPLIVHICSGDVK